MLKPVTIMNRLKIVVLVGFLGVITGCYSGSSITKIPNFSDGIVRVTDSSDKMNAYVSGINVKSNNAGNNIREGFDKRVLSQLQQSNYFNDVIYGVYSKKPDGKYVDLQLNVNENIDLNWGSNLTKAFFTGLTLFLLAPALPATYDFDLKHSLVVHWPDGTKREYVAESAGSSYGTWPYAPAVQKLNEAMGDATDKSLNSVINQLIADRK